jgi:uncharacterized protein YabE (DUF348 family)
LYLCFCASPPIPLLQHGTKGDLRVTFKIVFPDMSEAERQQIGNIIKNSHYASSAGGAKQARK